MEQWGKLFAVCCSADLDIKEINEFLTQSYEGARKMDTHAVVPCMVVIDDLNKEYTDGTDEIEGKGRFSSPFKDHDPEEIKRMVYELKQKTGSDVDLRACIILDGDAMSGQWAWVRHTAARKSEPDVKMIKVGWNKLYQVMMALKVSHPGWEEFVRWAKSSEDEVIRG